jgi:FeS assembly protein IscX
MTDLNWESTYAIALALKEAHPHVDLANVSLGQIFQWTRDLSEFQDDPLLVNDDILSAIYQDWLEETLHEQ